MADLNEKTPEVQSTETPKAEAKALKAKAKKPNFFVRMGKRISSFTRECISEMKKVTWLSRPETLKSSLVVLVIAVALAVVIGILDTGLQYGVNGLYSLGELFK